ncbi:hypothetical protein [Pilimelia columellifera]|uniref:Peptidase inhibitor I78 family protein n=1 Tax=Pilimelia columellifera subsp. columellifera TaxID=706583 RepID=A0ABN3ND53_9ACTN
MTADDTTRQTQPTVSVQASGPQALAGPPTVSQPTGAPSVTAIARAVARAVRGRPAQWGFVTVAGAVTFATAGALWLAPADAPAPSSGQTPATESVAVNRPHVAGPLPGPETTVGMTKPAPGTETPVTAVGPDAGTDPLGLTGMTLTQADAAARADDKIVRVVEVDGVSIPVTREYVENRINLELRDGKVVGFGQG